jgi:hypothetical protein
MQLPRWAIFITGVATAISLSGSAVAQDRGRGGFPGGGFPGGGFPGGPGGGFPGGGPPGGGFSGRGGFDPTEMLRRMDANGNGVLEQNELSGRGGDFVRRIAERAGVNPDQPMPIDRLARGMDFGRREDGDRNRDDRDRDRDRDNDNDNDRDRDRNQSSSSQAAAPPTGPQGFGATAAAANGVPGFDTPLMVGVSTEPIEKRFDARVIEYVRERMLEDRDANQNGLLERNEWTGRWSTPPDQMDTNRDGVLTMEEMCVTAARRFGADNSRSGDSRGGDSRSGDSRGGESRGGDSRFAGGGFGPPGGGFGPPGGGFDRGRGFGFGDRGGDRGGDGDSASRIRGYAEGFLRQYDENRDGRLDRDEWQQMPPQHQAADSNGDGIITSEELTAHLQKTVGERFAGRGGSSSSGDKKTAETKKSYRVSTPIERLPEGMPDWFLRNDLDADGQISMVEYASSWTDQIASEFTRLDANSDGIITPEEAKK